nr:UPF0149 family protein [uncultured Pseudomonas sp.]
MFLPLTVKELNRLEDMLIIYGNDCSVINLAELNGFFTALASSPTTVQPMEWLPAVAGGNVPKFKKPADEEAYTALMLRYASQIAEELEDHVDQFQPLFEQSQGDDGTQIVMEEWCFGYMRGTQVAGWADLPPEQDELLKAISLHGLEDNFELLDQMSEQDIQHCVPHVVDAVRQLYRFNHARG